MSIDHEAVKKCAQDCVELARGKEAEMQASDMAGVVGLAVAYLDLHAQLAAKDRRISALEAALGEAIESIEDWGAYISDYFRDKHDLRGDIARLTGIKEGREHE